MINHRKYFIFIHIPKTGGTSIFEAFKQQNLKGHFGHFMNINSYNYPVYRKYFKFAFHRNPWDRMVSVWRYWTEIRKDQQLVQKMPQTEFFSGFCNNLEKIFYEILDPKYEEIHIMNQVELNGYSEFLKLDFWGRFSNLNEDFKTICDRINIKYEPLPHLNRTTHKSYIKYYNDDLKKYVGKLFEKDIDTFKYTFDN